VGGPPPLQHLSWLSKAERALELITKSGRNAGAFNIAKTVFKLHWKGVTYWRDVAKAAGSARELLKHVDGLEKGARAFKGAADELHQADLALPNYPLQPGDKTGTLVVTPSELEYVEKYHNSAKLVADSALEARIELGKAIAGWDSVVREANAANDFTRKSSVEAVTDLDLRFQNSGGSFRAYLVEAHATAERVENSARMKQIHAAHILDKPTPSWYTPPSLAP